MDSIFVSFKTYKLFTLHQQESLIIYPIKKLLKNVLLLFLIYIPAIFGRTQNVYGQSSLHDSVQHMLTVLRKTQRMKSYKKWLERQGRYIQAM